MGVMSSRSNINKRVSYLNKETESLERKYIRIKLIFTPNVIFFIFSFTCVKEKILLISWSIQRDSDSSAYDHSKSLRDDS